MTLRSHISSAHAACAFAASCPAIAGASRALISLSLALAIGACSNDNPIAAPGTAVTVRVNVTPDSSIFEWDLAGPGDYQLSGRGDTVLVDMEEGEYEITWADAKGFVTPYPASETLTAAAGKTIAFIHTYQQRSSEQLKILFLGSSYFGSNMMVGLFRSLANAKGINLLTETRTPAGMYLDFHATDSQSISLINSRNWDCVILQGVGRIVAYPEDAHFDLIATLESLETTIHRNWSATRIIFCMPWAFEDGMTWTPGGTDTYFDMQQHIYDNTLTYPDIVDLEIAPVGWAWNAIMLEEPPLHYLHMYDWNHPSPRGSYLMASVIFCSVYLESVSGNPYMAGIPVKEAARLQETATSVVLDNLELWRLDRP